MSYDARATIDWYRTPLPPAVFKQLNERSDLLGFLQAGGFFATLCTTAGLALYSCAHWHWAITVLLVFAHGTVSHFYINGVHELVHNTVFQSRVLNAFFVRLLGFFGWCDWVWFTTSHANHHRYTLHPPRDGEVVLPVKGLNLKAFIKNGFIAPTRPYYLFKGALKTAMGKLEGNWTLTLFPPEQPEARRRLFAWNRFVFAGHLVILLGSIAAGLVTGTKTWFLVPVLVNFGSCYGGWLFFLVNNTQHVGLTDKVPDFRLCCRSMKVPAIVSFLYWHMQYHTEHHMYAAVPCYRLRQLHKLIKHDLPEPKGIIGTWQEITQILRRQEQEPAFQYQHPLPSTARPAVLGDRQAEVAAGSAPTDPAADCADLTPETTPPSPATA